MEKDSTRQLEGLVLFSLFDINLLFFDKKILTFKKVCIMIAKRDQPVCVCAAAQTLYFAQKATQK